MTRGRFITFEGGEGCGKSTQVARVKSALEHAGISVVLTREPGGTPLAEKIRGLLKDEREDPPCDRCELLLFLAARAQLVKHVIRPALARGAWVISDRFSDSTFAYQGYGRGLSLEFLEQANSFACDALVPDRTFLLDLDLETSFARMHSRELATHTSSDRIESAGREFHQRLRDGFLARAAHDTERIVRIDASQTVEKVEAEIWTSLTPFLK